MTHKLLGILLMSLITTLAWGQKFCTCQLERLTALDSDTTIYRASLTVFPEAMVQEVFFGILQNESVYFIQADISDRQYVYDETERNVSNGGRNLGRAVSLRNSLLAILSEDLFNVYCPYIYLDNKTHDFSSILSDLYIRPD